MAIGWTQLLSGIGGRLRSPGKATPVADADAFANVLADVGAKTASVPVTSHAKGGSVTAQATHVSSEKPKPVEQDDTPAPSEPATAIQAAAAAILVPLAAPPAPASMPALTAPEPANASASVGAGTTAVVTGTADTLSTNSVSVGGHSFQWNTQRSSFVSRLLGNPTLLRAAPTNNPSLSPLVGTAAVAPAQEALRSAPDGTPSPAMDAPNEAIASAAIDAAPQPPAAGASATALNTVAQQAQSSPGIETAQPVTAYQQGDRTRGIISRLMERVEIRFNPALRPARTEASAQNPDPPASTEAPVGDSAFSQGPASTPPPATEAADDFASIGASSTEPTTNAVEGRTTPRIEIPLTAQPERAAAERIQTSSAGTVVTQAAAPSVPMAGAASLRAQATPSHPITAAPAFAAPIPISQPSPRWRNTESSGHQTAPAAGTIAGQRPGPVPASGSAPVSTPIEPDPTETPIPVEPAPIPVTVTGTQSGPVTQSSPPPHAPVTVGPAPIPVTVTGTQSGPVTQSSPPPSTPVTVAPAPIPITVTGTQSGPVTQSSPPPKTPVGVDPAPIPITVTGTQSGPETQSSPPPNTPVEIGDPSPRWRNAGGNGRQSDSAGATTSAPRQAPVQPTEHTEPVQTPASEGLRQPVSVPNTHTLTSAPVENAPQPVSTFGSQSTPLAMAQTVSEQPIAVSDPLAQPANTDEAVVPTAATTQFQGARTENRPAPGEAISNPPAAPDLPQERTSVLSAPRNGPQEQAPQSAPSNPVSPTPAFAAPIPMSQPSPRWRNTESSGHQTAPAAGTVAGQRPGPVPTPGRAPVSTRIEPDPIETPIPVEPAPIPVTVTGTQSGPVTQSSPPPSTPITVDPAPIPVTVTGTQSGPVTQSSPPPKTPVEIGDPTPRWRNAEGNGRQAAHSGATTSAPRQTPVQPTEHTEPVQTPSAEGLRQPASVPNAQTVTPAPVEDATTQATASGTQTEPPLYGPSPESVNEPPNGQPVAPVATAPGQPVAPTAVPPISAPPYPFATASEVNSAEASERRAPESAVRSSIEPGVLNEPVVVGNKPNGPPTASQTATPAQRVPVEPAGMPTVAVPVSAAPVSDERQAAQAQVPHVQPIVAGVQSPQPVDVGGEARAVSAPAATTQPVSAAVVDPVPSPVDTPQHSIEQTSQPVQSNASAQATASAPLAGEVAATVAPEGYQQVQGGQGAAEATRPTDAPNAVPTSVGSNSDLGSAIAEAPAVQNANPTDATRRTPVIQPEAAQSPVASVPAAPAEITPAATSAQQPAPVDDGAVIGPHIPTSAAPAGLVADAVISTANAVPTPVSTNQTAPEATVSNGAAIFGEAMQTPSAAPLAPPSIPVAPVEPTVGPLANAPAPEGMAAVTAAPQLLEAVLPEAAPESQSPDAPLPADLAAPTAPRDARAASVSAPKAPIAAPDIPPSPVTARDASAPAPVASTPSPAAQSTIAPGAEPVIVQNAVTNTETKVSSKEPDKQVTAAQSAAMETGQALPVMGPMNPATPAPAEATNAPFAVPGQKAAEPAVSKDPEKPANTVPIPSVSAGARSGAADSIVQGLQAARTVAANPTGTGAPLASAAAVSDLSPRRVVDQVVRDIRVEVGHGRSEMTIRLDPPELGQVAVRLVSQNGAVTAGFHAETDGVRSILEAHIPALRTALAEAGINVSSFTVSTGANFGASQQRSTDQQPTSRRRELSRRATPAAAQAVEAGRGRRMTTSVDYFA